MQHQVLEQFTAGMVAVNGLNRALTALEQMRVARVESGERGDPAERREVMDQLTLPTRKKRDPEVAPRELSVGHPNDLQSSCDTAYSSSPAAASPSARFQ